MNMYKYFIYSKEQHKTRTAVEKTIGKTFTPGTVMVRGERKKYTEVNTTGKSKFSDAKIIAEGEDSRMTFTPIKSV